MPKDLTLENIKKLNLKYIFTDIDDTLTLNGKLKANAYDMLWKLKDAGFHIIPVTGRPAGWCELIVRLWPVDAVIGENGGFYFLFENNTIKRVFANTHEERTKNKKALKQIETEVLDSVPGAALASDQFTRLMDLAIDFCEDVKPLASTDVEKIVAVFKKYGATAKVSSIHVNGWFGHYDKISMIKTYCQNHLKKDFESLNSQCLFVGDSPNDEPSFKAFEHSVGVSNIKRFLPDLKHKPSLILDHEGGDGFAVLGKSLIN